MMSCMDPIELETALSSELWANSQAYASAFREEPGDAAANALAARSAALLGYLVGQAELMALALRTCEPADRPTWSKLALPLARGIAAALKAGPRWLDADGTRGVLAALVASSGIDDLLVLTVLGGGRPFKATAQGKKQEGA